MDQWASVARACAGFMKMKVEVLLSCMFQQDIFSLIEKTNIRTDALVVNQCDFNGKESFEFVNDAGKKCMVRIIHTTERGLSRSRNMAMQNASGDLCLFCDDDIVLENDYEESIIDAFAKYPDEAILAFRINYSRRQCSEHTFKVGILNAARISSVQIVFKRSRLNGSILFCEKMGSGSGNGGGEENKFLVDCIKSGHSVRYVPSLILTVCQSDSLWFHGFDKRYWRNRGWTAKMIYGSCLGYLYLWYTLVFRCYRIDKNHHWYNHLIWLHAGFFDNRN